MECPAREKCLESFRSIVGISEFNKEISEHDRGMCGGLNNKTLYH